MATLKTYQWIIFFTMFIGYGFYNYNRKAVSFTLPSLLEYKLTKSDAGLITSSQNLAYAISKFIGGILSDRVSARLMFTVGLFFTGLTTLLFSFSDSVLLFVIFWFCNGLAQGAGWPACVQLLRKWYPTTIFGTVWSLLSASVNVAGILCPALAVYFIVNYNWQRSLLMAGILSMAFSTVCMFSLINSPTEVGYKSFVSLKSPQSKNSKKESRSSQWKLLLGNRVLLIVSLSYLIVFCAKTAFSDWAQVYLIEDKGLSVYQASSFISSLEAGGFVGGIIAGYITDWISAKQKKEKSSRQSPRLPTAMVFTIILVISLHYFCFFLAKNSSSIELLGTGFLVGLCLYGPIAIYGMVAIESAPIHLAGTAHSIAGLAANFGATIAGLPLSYVAMSFGWLNAFFFLELLCLLGVTLQIAALLNAMYSPKSKVN